MWVFQIHGINSVGLSTFILAILYTFNIMSLQLMTRRTYIPIVYEYDIYLLINNPRESTELELRVWLESRG